VLTIKSIIANEIIDSRGYPTIEASALLSNYRTIRTSVPSGTSVGKYEAHEMRDKDENRFDGMGVTKAVSIINQVLAPKLIGVSPSKHREIDDWMIKADGTKNKVKLGGNTTLALSQLFIKAAALEQGVSTYRYVNAEYTKRFKSEVPLQKIPTPIFNVINGGKHANNNLEFQEFQVIPSSSLPFTKAYQMGVEIFHELKRVLTYRNASVSVGEEGGFAPNFTTNIDAIEVINETVQQKNLKMGLDIFLGLDVASSHFFKNDRYYVKDKSHPLTKEEYLEFILNLTTSYSLLCLEDPLDQDDFEGWSKLLKAMPRDMYLIGDDLLATNKERVERAIKEKACSMVLVKPNQIGTISEILEVIELAKKSDLAVLVSHRSGETNDSFIADFAVGVQADFVKFGAPSRGERVAKYNRLWQIEREKLAK